MSQSFSQTFSPFRLFGGKLGNKLKNLLVWIRERRKLYFFGFKEIMRNRINIVFYDHPRELREFLLILLNY